MAGIAIDSTYDVRTLFSRVQRDLLCVEGGVPGILD